VFRASLRSVWRRFGHSSYAFRCCSDPPLLMDNALPRILTRHRSGLAPDVGPPRCYGECGLLWGE
jgi:hypothetical protein